jgi:site-specific recombinase XerD
MASLINDSSKSSYIIRLSERESPTGRRVKIFCGTDLDEKEAERALLHVEHLITAKQTKTAMPQDTVEWLIDPRFSHIRKRLEELQIITPEKTQTDITVVEFMGQTIARLHDKKPNTIRIYERSLYFVKQHFGDMKLVEVTSRHARQFRAFLLVPDRSDGGKRLGENTTRKMICKLRTIFNIAIEEELITKNPFKVKGLPTNVSNSHKDREKFIERATIDKVIKFAPDAEFAFIIALARYGGLRTPSEFRLLKHGDFFLSEDPACFYVFAPKTEYRQPEPRKVPLFPELLPHIKKLISSSEAAKGKFVFSERYRTCSEANITNIMRRTIKNAGVTLWPKLWQNLRASRATELVRETEARDIKGVSDWLGHSPAVLLKHYLRANDDAFRRATQPIDNLLTGDLKGDLNPPEPTELEVSKRKSTRRRNQQKTPILRKTSHKRVIARGREVLPVGLEPTTYGLRVSCSTN